MLLITPSGGMATTRHGAAWLCLDPHLGLDFILDCASNTVYVLPAPKVKTDKNHSHFFHLLSTVLGLDAVGTDKVS